VSRLRPLPVWQLSQERRPARLPLAGMWRRSDCSAAVVRAPLQYRSFPTPRPTLPLVDASANEVDATNRAYASAKVKRENTWSSHQRLDRWQMSPFSKDLTLNSTRNPPDGFLNEGASDR
jgi:hypothetical protein